MKKLHNRNQSNLISAKTQAEKVGRNKFLLVCAVVLLAAVLFAVSLSGCAFNVTNNADSQPSQTDSQPTEAALSPEEITIAALNSAIEQGERYAFSYEINGYKIGFFVENNGLTVSNCPQEYRGDLVIPDEVYGVPVTAISGAAFYRCGNITGITLPDSIERIGNDAFNGCKGIGTFIIPEKVTRIEARTFYDCRTLWSVTIPDGVTLIDDYAFSYCKRLSDIVIPEGVTKLGVSAFEYCENLGDLYIPDSVTSLGSGIFYGCDNIRILCTHRSAAHIYCHYNSVPFKVLYNTD